VTGYNYENWKDETNLSKVCLSLLDNADMDMEIQSSPLSITLTFFVVGSNIKVVFCCSDITKLHLLKEFDDRPLHLVLEVNVKKPKKTRDPSLSDGEFSILNHKDYSWSIEVLPVAQIEIECLLFNWQLEMASEKELSYRM
jgi:hypothetical protein